MPSHVLDASSDPRYPFVMAKEIPSLGDVRREAEITKAKIDAATDEDGVTPAILFIGLGLLGGCALLVVLGIIFVMI